MSDGDPRGRTRAWLGARSREALHAEAAHHRSWGWATSALEEHIRTHRRDWADAFGRLLSVDEVRQLSGVVRATPERVYVEIDARGQATLL